MLVFSTKKTISFYKYFPTFPSAFSCSTIWPMPMIKILKISGAESRINSRTCLGYLVSLQLRAALSSCCDATSSSSWHHSQRRAKTKKIIHRDINTILLNSSESVSYQFSGNGRHLENIVKKNYTYAYSPSELVLWAPPKSVGWTHLGSFLSAFCCLSLSAWTWSMVINNKIIPLLCA